MPYSRIEWESLMEEQKQLRAEINGLMQSAKELEKMATAAAAEKLEAYFEKEADKIAAGVAAERHLGEDGKAIIRQHLSEESMRLAFFYKNQYEKGVKQFLGKWAMFTRNMAMGTMTMGDMWHQMWANLWSILFGPWVVGLGFLFLQFLLVTNYFPQSATKSLFVIMAPIMGAGGVFMLNFMNSKNPMDWLTHMVSGAIISYTFGILLVGIFYSMSSFPGGTIWFWIIWGFMSVFIGAFSLYQLGGFRAVMQIAVIVLLFGYLALGPYQAMYRSSIDRIKEPFTLAFRVVINSFKDVWLLTTNPTEWYAKQQLKNVRSEQPLEQPKGIEIIRLESLTPSVGIPDGEQFEIFAIMQNQGKMTATGITASAKCNEFCVVPLTAVEHINAQLKPGNVPRDMSPDEQFQLRLMGFTAKKPGREAFQIAKVTLNIEYDYSTNTTLPVTIANNKEISRALAAMEDIFRPVTSIAMPGPAEISLNVGPQPLKAGSDASLLVAVLNSKPDGIVKLKRDTQFYIDVPPGIGSIKHGSCRTGSGQVQCFSGEDENYRCSKLTDKECVTNGCIWNNNDGCKPAHSATCIVQPTAEKIRWWCNAASLRGKALDSFCKTDAELPELQIKATEFSSILPVYCELTTAQAEVFKSDRIKAVFPSYRFETSKKLEVMVTQALGVAKQKQGE